MVLTQTQSDKQKGPVAMKERLCKDAERSFLDVGDTIVIERFISIAVDELYGDRIKVTAFVPVLAMRRVRDLVDVHVASSSQVAT